MAPLFVFDLDEVLYSYDWRLRMNRLSVHTGLPVAALRERWWHMEGEGAAEAGAFATPEEYLDAATSALGVSVTREDWVAIRGSVMTPLPESIAAAARAAELGRMSLLTNNGSLIGAELPRLAPLLVPIFGADHLRATAYYGARKPDPRVFERVLEAYQVAPEETFFADDRLENVESAASVGIVAHHFQGGAGLLAAIEEFSTAF